MLVLNLSLGHARAQDSPEVTGMAPGAWSEPNGSATTDEALREQVAQDEWLEVRVELRQPEGDAPEPGDTAQAAILQDELEWTAQDLLFALPVGSYDRVQRERGSPGLTLRVDAAGLDELLVSPWVAAVTATSNTGIARIAAGGGHSLALKLDGSLLAWGYNTYGQIGDGTRTNRLSPVQVLSNVITMAGGEGHTLATQTDGTDDRTLAWGWNLDGQLGDGTTTDRLSPVPVTPGGSQLFNSHFVAGGGHHSLAIEEGGHSRLWAWGNNLEGQLGDDTTERRLNPVLVRISDTVAATAGGRYQSLALLTDGTLWAWGSNWAGQLGDGTTTQRRIPVQVRQSQYQFFTEVMAVASGDHHSLAIKTDGSLWAWGSNSDGQLGDGTFLNRAYPVQVLSGVVAVAAGKWGTLALKTDGTLWAWGENLHGEVGNGGGPDVSTPVLIMDGVASIAGGGWHSLALKTDGTLWAWGWNPWGQLGDGTTISRSRPVQVPGFGGSDFVVTNLVLTPSAPFANGTFGVAVTVKNQGTVAGTPGMLQVWANQAAGQNCGAVGDKFTTLTSSLAAGATQTVTLSGLPAGVAGAKTLRAFVDSECLTAEANEANNQATKPY
ncbi:MAG: hypothetical protein KBE53_04300, partial [Chromatiaceae bacterium]|nr:hypothetical protein [Chromatiaceae bacterium]